MQEHVTLLPPDAPSPGSRRISSTLPPDLLEQVRGRVRLLALILLIGFAFDPFIYFLIWTIATLGGYPVVLGNLWFRVVDLSAVAASAGLWWVARTRKVSSAHLHTLGLIYVVAICFIIALTMFWQYYLDKGLLLPLTWVPAVVILFPLILPGPPRRMLVAAVLAGAMAPLALAVLDLSERMPVDAEAYFNAITSSAFAAGLPTWAPGWFIASAEKWRRRVS